MKNVVIFGASGHGSVIMDCIEKEGKYNIIGFVDSIKQKGGKHNGYKILGSEYDLKFLFEKHDIYGGIVAIGDNWIRRQVVGKIEKIIPEFKFITVIHPNTVIGRDVKIGEGAAIMPGVIINTNSSIGNHCILNTYSSLDHDSKLQDYSSLAPRVSTGGNFSLGKFSAVCLGAQIIENITVGDHSVIGAGSLVLKNVPDFSMVYGFPAKYIRNRHIGEAYISSSGDILNQNIQHYPFKSLFRVL